MSSHRGILNALTNDHGGGGGAQEQQRQKYFGIWPPPFREEGGLLAPEKNLLLQYNMDMEGKKGAIVNVMRG